MAHTYGGGNETRSLLFSLLRIHCSICIGVELLYYFSTLSISKRLGEVLRLHKRLIILLVATKRALHAEVDQMEEAPNGRGVLHIIFAASRSGVCQ